VEEEADDARPVAGVHADGAVHDGLDEVLGAGAGGVVVPDLQLRLRREAGQCHDDDGEDGEPTDLRTPGHLSPLHRAHCYLATGTTMMVQDGSNSAVRDGKPNHTVSKPTGIYTSSTEPEIRSVHMLISEVNTCIVLPLVEYCTRFHMQ
jgi:hypothetical protein